MVNFKNFNDVTNSALLDAIDIPIHVVDTNGILVCVNKSWEHWMHESRNTAIGTEINQVMKKLRHGFYFAYEKSQDDGDKNAAEGSVTHYDKEEFRSAAMDVIQNNRPASQLTFSDNGHRIFVTSNPIFKSSGELEYVVTYLTDLTGIEHLKDELDTEIKKSVLISAELSMYRSQATSSQMIFESDKMRNVDQLIEVIAPVDANVLIMGESGVGKEVVANQIQKRSNRSGKPFIKVNCAAIPNDLMESELFGHEKGAFTGADVRKIGMFELASGGTILLDEIGDIPLKLQSKLLRVLQEHTIRRIGGDSEFPVDVRVIASTNRNLGAMMREGTFSVDLYYRLAVMPIVVPPLRERREDIKPLALFYLSIQNQKYNKSKEFSDNALIALTKYNWPGNIRELFNVIERLVIVGKNEIITSARVSELINSNAEDSEIMLADNTTLQKYMDSYEKKLLQKAVERYGSTYSIARALGTSQPTISRKLKYHGIKVNYK